MFLLLGGLAALFFLFNTGQLTAEKTKLVNTADAVAYSAGVMNARTLNFDAYTNRAMVANTIAIAQLTSLASWVRYADAMGTFGFVLQNPKLSPYYLSYETAVDFGPDAKSELIDQNVLENLVRTSDNLITNLRVAQAVANAGLLPARAAVMNEVAQANYRGDGTVTVDLMLLSPNDFPQFVQQYAGDERTRFAQAVQAGLSRDRFIERRSWMMPALYSDCGSATATGRVDWLDRRGGTELIGFDEWKALDTLSEKRWVPKNKTDVMCRAVKERPAGWGGQSAADNPTLDLDPLHYDSAPLVNPGATAVAVATSTSAWGYSGLPSFFDLSPAALDQPDPRLQFAVRLHRDRDQTLTSDGRSSIQSAQPRRLNPYSGAPANEVYAAVAASDVYFARPGSSRDNVYGASIGRPRELGSLFNPYWDTRLRAPSLAELQQAQAWQGVVLP
ncbi:hypothetical protein [Caldimonas brevitalea]|uniref:hypothetical protein n=1 Tax=Caldimonas brevitalea TaxID=413882 RepID=UPI0014708239